MWSLQYQRDALQIKKKKIEKKRKEKKVKYQRILESEDTLEIFPYFMD